MRPVAAGAVRCFAHPEADIARSLGLGEALLERAGGTGPELEVNFWRPAARGIVLGSACRMAEEMAAEGCRARGVPAFRRMAGGGTVLLGPETWCYSFVWAGSLDPGTIEGAFAAVGKVVIDALRRLGLKARMEPISDLAADVPARGACKIAGHGQRRRRTGVLCAGSLIAAPFPFPLSEVLRHPPREPPYRKGRTHEQFITSLRELGVDASFEAFVEAMLRELDAPALESPDRAILDRAGELAREKYLNREWTERL